MVFSTELCTLLINDLPGVVYKYIPTNLSIHVLLVVLKIMLPDNLHKIKLMLAKKKKKYFTLSWKNVYSCTGAYVTWGHNIIILFFTILCRHIHRRRTLSQLVYFYINTYIESVKKWLIVVPHIYFFLPGKIDYSYCSTFTSLLN